MAACEELTGGNIDERNTEVFMLCPFHPESLGRRDRSIGSFSVNIETGDSWCFSCQTGGNFADVVSAVLDISYEDALKWILKRGVSLEVRRKERPKIEAPTVSEASLAAFDLPPKRELDARRIDQEAAEFYGLLWDGKGWILPIRTPTGDLMGWQRKRGAVVLNYPKDAVETGHTLFGAHLFDEVEMGWLESPLDCARARSAGVDGCVASFGTSWTQQQVAIAVELTQYVVCAMDNDPPGWRAALGYMNRKKRRWVPGLRDTVLGARMRFLNYDRTPDAKDIGDMTDKQVRWAFANAKHSFMFGRK